MVLPTAQQTKLLTSIFYEVTHWIRGLGAPAAIRTRIDAIEEAVDARAKRQKPTAPARPQLKAIAGGKR